MEDRRVRSVGGSGDDVFDEFIDTRASGDGEGLFADNTSGVCSIDEEEGSFENRVGNGGVKMFHKQSFFWCKSCFTNVGKVYLILLV